ncbi:hypothetical protein ACIPW5_06465 [Streptomyces sp. NPDC090077]|uniref:hypothetical protein n=1 Tax=Streptomyces sp. NPDC090077 TaxID=3365938 RepID=UPI00381D382C
MTHPRWGLQFHWWAVDPSGRVGLFYSAFGPVPSAANAHAQAMDETTAWARARHPEWFDAGCAEHDCPQHCVIELARAPYLYTWDEEHDDRYSRYGVPTRPLVVSELPAAVAAGVGLVGVDFSFDQAARIDLEHPAGRETLSASALTPWTYCQRQGDGRGPGSPVRV